MPVGIPVDKSTLDTTAGRTVLQLAQTFDQVVRLKNWLDAKTDAELLALGYVAAEITLLRASFTDLSNLVKVARGQGTQAAANDFFFNARKLTGLLA
jgi:hypothetical protein